MDLAGPEPELVATKEDKPIDQYFEGFTRLGDQIFFYKPSRTGDGAETTLQTSPDLIVFCSWLYALPKHISKYITAYQKIYPSTSILLLKQDGPDLLWRPTARQMENLGPAVSIVKGPESGMKTKPKILMHVFSNGGSFTACQLADAYTLQSEPGHAVLPISALVIDSAPSIPTISTGYVAMTHGLPKSLPAPLRALGGVILYSFIGVASVVGSLLGSEDVISSMRRKLNDSKGPFMQNGVNRMYIYSETDQLVPWQHVEAHAKEARLVVEELGIDPIVGVRMEKFVGSKHVGHVVVDSERYWGLVRSFWEDCNADSQ